MRLSTVRTVALAAILPGVAASSAAAQRAPPDTRRPLVVLSEALAGPGDFVTVLLAGSTAYRVEVVPATTIDIRPVRLGDARPRVSRATENHVEAAGGYSLVVVPYETGEFRLSASQAPVSIRILTDPDEQAILEGRARSAWQQLTVSARWVGMFGAIVVTEADTVHDFAGWEICIGVMEGTVPFARRLCGCAFTMAQLESREGIRQTFFGLAPRYRLNRGRPFTVDAVANIAFATEFESFGLGLSLGAGFDKVAFEVEPGISFFRRNAYTRIGGPSGSVQVPAATTVLPRLAGGIRVHF